MLAIYGAAAEWLLTLILSVILTIVFTLLLRERLQWLLVRLAAGLFPSGPRTLKGIWQARYTYHTDDDATQPGSVEYHVLQLSQIGPYVWGKNFTGADHQYKLRGRFRHETYFTGFWENIHERNIYHGAFQLILDVKGNRMAGKLLGFDRNGNINHGSWTWTLLASRPNRRERLRVLNEAAESRRIGTSAK